MQINYKKKQPKSIRRNHIDKLTELYKQPEGSIEAYSKTQALRIQNSQKAQKKMKKLREIMKKPDIQRNKIPITSSSFDADREKTQEEEQIIVYQQQSERSQTLFNQPVLYDQKKVQIPRLNSNNIDLNRVTDPNTPRRKKQQLGEVEGFY